MIHYVIGGCGFTGTKLVDRLLEQGQTVTCVDIIESDRPTSTAYTHFQIDICNPEQLSTLPLAPDDIIYHLGARQYHLAVPNRQRRQFFDQVNYLGTRNILELMKHREIRKLIYFSSDMVYGYPQSLPVKVSHPMHPIGPYGESKKRSETLCAQYREYGINITIMRPRMIIGPGRIGILAKLFKLIDLNLPVPMIGNGSNHYQMISVFDCVEAIMAAVDRGIPNGIVNLGSIDPPSVKTLLGNLVRHADSKSIVMPTPGYLVKKTLAAMNFIGLPIMYPEQYLIADKDCLLDISETTELLGWKPAHTDQQMMNEAYDWYNTNTS